MAAEKPSLGKAGRDSLRCQRRTAMRGDDEQTGALFSYVSCEARVPADHPLRLIRAVVDEALDVLSAEFDRLYARVGRPGIAPEKLLRALLLSMPLEYWLSRNCRAARILRSDSALARGAIRIQPDRTLCASAY
jgi:hypothetical protein